MWCILVSVAVCTYTCVEAKAHQNRCFIFETSLSLNLRSINLIGVAGQWASWVFLSPPTHPIPTVLNFQAHVALPDLCRCWSFELSISDTLLITWDVSSATPTLWHRTSHVNIISMNRWSYTLEALFKWDLFYACIRWRMFSEECCKKEWAVSHRPASLNPEITTRKTVLIKLLPGP